MFVPTLCCQLINMWRVFSGLQDYQAALKIDLHNEVLQADTQRIRDTIQGTAAQPETQWHTENALCCLFVLFVPYLIELYMLTKNSRLLCISGHRLTALLGAGIGLFVCKTMFYSMMLITWEILCQYAQSALVWLNVTPKGKYKWWKLMLIQWKEYYKYEFYISAF